MDSVWMERSRCREVVTTFELYIDVGCHFKNRINPPQQMKIALPLAQLQMQIEHHGDVREGEGGRPTQVGRVLSPADVSS